MIENKQQHLIELLKQFKTGILVTKARQSQEFRARPMSVAQVDDNGDLWFITSDHAHMVEEIQRDGHVVVTFQKESCYVVFSGLGMIIEDRAKLESLWQPAFSEWVEEGLSNPSIALIQVKAAYADYWDHSGINYTAIFQTMANLLSAHGI